jgi:hypothetical protein
MWRIDIPRSGPDRIPGRRSIHGNILSLKYPLWEALSPGAAGPYFGQAIYASAADLKFVQHLQHARSRTSNR